MKSIKIDANNPEKGKIKQAISVLESGGVVVYPTDTVYGLGADIFNENAVKKVFNIKKRPFNKPLSVCVSKTDDIKNIAYLDKEQEDKVHDLLPGPYTLILRKKEHVSSLLTAGMDKIGIRIPNNKVCQELTRKFPITTTSANLSGEKVPRSAEEVRKQLGDEVDLVLDAGVSKDGIPSKVIDLTVKPPQILREGL